MPMWGDSSLRSSSRCQPPPHVALSAAIPDDLYDLWNAWEASQKYQAHYAATAAPTYWCRISARVLIKRAPVWQSLSMLPSIQEEDVSESSGLDGDACDDVCMLDAWSVSFDSGDESSVEIDADLPTPESVLPDSLLVANVAYRPCPLKTDLCPTPQPLWFTNANQNDRFFRKKATKRRQDTRVEVDRPKKRRRTSD